MLIMLLLIWLLDILIPAVMIPGYVYAVLGIATCIVFLISLAAKDNNWS